MGVAASCGVNGDVVKIVDPSDIKGHVTFVLDSDQVATIIVRW